MLYSLYHYNERSVLYRGEFAMSVSSTSSSASTSPATSSVWTRILGASQSLARSLMLPVAVLPVAGLLLRLGQPDVLNLPWVANAGDAIFGNLPLIFSVCIAFGLAGGEGAAALAGAVGYLVLMAVYKTFISAADIKAGLNPDVFAGLLSGLIAAWLYRRYHRIRLPDYLGFFGGRRFVPILTGLVMVVLGALMALVWPFVGNGLKALTIGIAALGAAGPAIYGFLNRLLIPLGLHHVLNFYIWQVFGDYHNASGGLVHGDLLGFAAGDKAAGLFESGFYPIMMFGLPAACLAMIRQARFPKVAAGILISAALASFLTGITEPIEFAFIFVAPVLYVIHAVLTGTALLVCYILGIHLSFSFSAGLIDYILYFKAPAASDNVWMIIPVGLVYAVVYYFVFSFVIKRFNIGTPGRGEASTGLSADWILPESQRGPAPSKNGATAEVASDTLAGQVIDALGGKGNIESVEGCITRLRLFLTDPDKVDEDRLKSLGSQGVIKQGKVVQVVMGMQSDQIAGDMNTQLKGGSTAERTISD
jgi:PTS system N-acetylglucosamine-specific IIC component